MVQTIFVSQDLMSHLDLGPPILLKVSKGQMGNIQCTHMGGWLDVTGPHVTLGPGTPPPC